MAAGFFAAEVAEEPGRLTTDCTDETDSGFVLFGVESFMASDTLSLEREPLNCARAAAGVRLGSARARLRRRARRGRGGRESGFCTRFFTVEGTKPSF